MNFNRELIGLRCYNRHLQRNNQESLETQATESEFQFLQINQWDCFQTSATTLNFFNIDKVRIFTENLLA